MKRSLCSTLHRGSESDATDLSSNKYELAGSTNLGFVGARKGTWAELWKRNFWVMTFQVSLSNGARLRLIEINGALVISILTGLVWVFREWQKRHRPPSDKASGLSSDTALYHYKYKKLTWKCLMSKWNEHRKRKNTYSQTSQLEISKELQLLHKHEKFLYLTVLLLFAQHKMHFWWLVTWLDWACVV
jgi:hypothetical protein